MFELLKQGPYACIHCGYPKNKNVYKFYGDQNGGNHHSRTPSSVMDENSNDFNQNDYQKQQQQQEQQQKSNKLTPRLMKCEKCKQLVDEYVELDYNILYLDAILQKTIFYRHILHNCRLSSNKTALKMAFIFYFCEAFQRWSTTNGVIFTSERKTTTTATTSSTVSLTSSYFQLEVSFYYDFICIILESSLFNALFYCLFKLAINFARKKHQQMKTNCQINIEPTFKETFMSLIICSYGKLFLIPCILYGGDLRQILEYFIRIFHLFSLVQCTNVKSHSLLNRFRSILLVSITFTIHMLLMTVLYNWLLPSNFINKLQYFLV